MLGSASLLRAAERALDLPARVPDRLDRLLHGTGRGAGLARFVRDLVLLRASDLGSILGPSALGLFHLATPEVSVVAARQPPCRWTGARHVIGPVPGFAET